MAPPLPSPTATSTGGATTILGSRTGEVRRDPIFNRWVIFSPARARRPSDFKSRSPSTATSIPNNPNGPAATPPASCPFCIGREGECAPEIFRVPTGTGNWRVRVIENLYPALRRDLDPPEEEPREIGPDCGRRTSMRGFGFHDVVIETPQHEVHLSNLSPAQAGELLLAYKERILQLEALGTVKYVQVFKNHGASAGASMSHSHSQIMGLPFIPAAVFARMESMKDCFTKSGKCSLCEVQSEDILIDKSSHYFSIVPFAASYPFEIWIVPQNHVSHFHEIDHEKAVDLGGLLTLMLRKLSKQLNDPPFNFMIQSSPLDTSTSSLPYAHWFLQIIPQLSVIGGFEMGSGCYINPVFSEDGASLLREVKL